MNDYEKKQEANRQRFAARADKADRCAGQHARARDAIMDAIPPGQPVLVGHHSERRHRRDLDRLDRHMGKAVEESKKADYYRGRAASVGTAGISSDDPEAVDKLRDKLAASEARQEDMKKANSEYRKHNGWDGVDLPDETIRRCRSNMELSGDRKPFPSYALTNNSSNMRRIRARIAELEAAAATPARDDICGEGFTISENKHENRILFIFDTKPSREVCKLMRSNGWRFSRRLTAWMRHLNNGGRNSAKFVVTHLANNNQ